MTNLFCFLNIVYDYLNFFNIDVAFCFYLVLIILLFCAVFFVVYLFLYYSLFLLVTLFLFFFNFIFLFLVVVNELYEFFLFFWLNPFSQNHAILGWVLFFFLRLINFFTFSLLFRFLYFGEVFSAFPFPVPVDSSSFSFECPYTDFSEDSNFYHELHYFSQDSFFDSFSDSWHVDCRNQYQFLYENSQYRHYVIESHSSFENIVHIGPNGYYFLCLNSLGYNLSSIISFACSGIVSTGYYFYPVSFLPLSSSTVFSTTISSMSIGEVSNILNASSSFLNVSSFISSAPVSVLSSFPYMELFLGFGLTSVAGITLFDWFLGWRFFRYIVSSFSSFDSVSSITNNSVSFVNPYLHFSNFSALDPIPFNSFGLDSVPFDYTNLDSIPLVGSETAEEHVDPVVNSVIFDIVSALIDSIV